MTRPSLTLATRFTLLRILLVPVFILCVLYYAAGHREGHPSELLRMAAILVFAAASLTDALDGRLARARGEETVLGTYLDPIADKALLLSAVVVLSSDQGGAFERFPLWFPVLVISRDAVLVLGVALIHILGGHVIVRPTLVGKLATVAQMASVGWVLLGLTFPSVRLLTAVAGGLTLLAGVQYVRQGSRFLNVEPRPAGT